MVQSRWSGSASSRSPCAPASASPSHLPPSRKTRTSTQPSRSGLRGRPLRRAGWVSFGTLMAQRWKSRRLHGVPGSRTRSSDPQQPAGATGASSRSSRVVARTASVAKRATFLLGSSCPKALRQRRGSCTATLACGTSSRIAGNSSTGSSRCRAPRREPGSTTSPAEARSALERAVPATNAAAGRLMGDIEAVEIGSTSAFSAPSSCLGLD